MAFRIMITQEKKSKVIDEYRAHSDDTGSTEVQVAILTARIEELTSHFKEHSKATTLAEGFCVWLAKGADYLIILKAES